MKLSRSSHLLIIGGVAIAANVAYLLYMNPFRPLGGDGAFYLAIAKTLAERFRYLDPTSLWPNQPAMGRAPVWPFVVSIALRLTSRIDPNLVIRLTGACLNAVTATLIALLTQRLFGSKRSAVIAGLFYAVYPPALYFMDLGLSEPLFVFLTALALWCGIYRERLWQVSALLFGIGCLVRSNFVLMAVFFPVVCLWRVWVNGLRITPALARRISLLVVWFSFPSALWIARNYAVSGHFPVLSTIRGETFYGAYNDVTANSLGNWGYWVYPPEIPGEPEKKVLAASMREEKELDDYYFKKGKDYAVKHLDALPRLILGRLVRAYVPIPWNPDAAAYVASMLRVALYLIFFTTLPVWRNKSGPTFNVILTSMALVSIGNVILFYGSARFAFVLDAFFIPCAAFGLAAPERGIIARWRERMGIEPTQPDVVRSHQF